MPIPWNDATRGRGQLLVYADRSLQDSAWKGLLDECLKEFNHLARTHRLGVTFARAKEPPAQAGGGGADVAVAAAAGKLPFVYRDQEEELSGQGLHGRTFLIGQPIERALVFLPKRPMINTPQGMRPVGPGVLKVIGVHELVHACGLSNQDHSPDGVFQTYPSTAPGDRAAGDKVAVRPGKYDRMMPPIVLSAVTVAQINQLWPRK